MIQRYVSLWNQVMPLLMYTCQTCWEMCHLFVILVFFSSLQPKSPGSSAPVSKCHHPVSNIKLILGHSGRFMSLNPEVHPQSRHFQYFLPEFFSVPLFLLLKLLKRTLVQYLLLRCEVIWRFFKEKGTVEWLIIDILSCLLQSSFESCWKCLLDHPVSLHFLLLGPVGPLTKKHTDDLSDSDRTDDEGIFFYPIPPFWCQTDVHDKGNPDLPFLLQFLSSLIFLHFLSFFESDGHFLFALHSWNSLLALDVFCPFQLDVWKNSCLPSFFD